MNIEAEQNLANLYNLYGKASGTTRTLRDGLAVGVAVIANLGAATYSFFLNNESGFSHFYRESYGWAVGLATFYPAQKLVERLDRASYRERAVFVKQIALLQGRTVVEDNSDQIREEMRRADEVVQLGTDYITPGSIHTEFFDIGYRLNRRFGWNPNEYEFQINNALQHFNLWASHIEQKGIVKEEIMRDALILQKTRLLEEAGNLKISDRRRILASRLVVEIDSKLSNLPPYIPHRPTEN